MRSLNALAWRNLAQHRLRTVSSALAVALGAAMTVAAAVTSGAILDALSRSESAQTFLTGLLDQLDSMLTLVGVGITFAAGFLVFNAFAMSITQRRRQIGALRLLGMTRRQVMRLVLGEALVTGSAGTLVGLVAGPLLGRWRHRSNEDVHRRDIRLWHSRLVSLQLVAGDGAGTGRHPALSPGSGLAGDAHLAADRSPSGGRARQAPINQSPISPRRSTGHSGADRLSRRRSAGRVGGRCPGTLS